MTKPTISANELREMLAFDSETGVFTWRKRIGTRAQAGAVAGNPTADGYMGIKLCRKSYLAHRLAWLHVHGEWPSKRIDHIDGNRSNNAIANLRDVSASVNSQNQKRARSDNKTGYLGVCEWDGKFVAQIGLEGRIYKLGSFDAPELAHAAYLSAKRQMHTGCTI